MNTHNNNTPLMYKGYIIYSKNTNKMLSAYNYAKDIHINPLYKTWEQLKIVIDAMNK